MLFSLEDRLAIIAECEKVLYLNNYKQLFRMEYYRI